MISLLGAAPLLPLAGRADEVIEEAYFCCSALCRLLALSSRAGRRQPRQLSGVKRTPQNLAAAAANDPQETWRALIVFGAPG
jgi:hypothetical protein